ncbi:bifunctional diguanylate cyclase/phosphodiesterase [Thiomonas intermedia]|uniref:bifunctional diguanylate cyclase/phosphodiesterase n=1 Tax=Thiomonas intermedia TaxID=926 RepID=UPI0009A4C13A|nr:bifunctional diguanylate cyclase/phosphodiesterase [Thiomonas intermedia]
MSTLPASLDATPHSAAKPLRVDALRGLIIAASWMIAAQMTVQWFHIGPLPFSIIWPANGMAYGFVAVYGVAAVAPAALGVLVWNLAVQQQPLVDGLLGTLSFCLSMLLAAWALRRLRSAPDDNRTAVRDALQYYGILIGLCIPIDLALGIAQYSQTQVWNALSLHNLLFIYGLSAAFGVLFFTRLTELTIRNVEARLMNASGFAPRPAGRRPTALRSFEAVRRFFECTSSTQRRQAAALWLVVWASFTLACAVLIEHGEFTYGNALRYLSFLLLAIVVFRFSSGFAHLGLMLTGVAQIALAQQALGDSTSVVQYWADQAVMVAVFGVISLLGIATIAEQRWAQRQLARQAHEDLLTGLLNDRGYARAIENTRPRPSAHLLAIEVMQLGAIEELVGLAHRQEVERAVALSLQEVCNDDCSLARPHDGYFTLVAPTREQARQLAEHVWKSLDGRRFQFEEHGVWLHVAIGAVPLRPELAASEQMALLALATQVAGDRFDHRIHFSHEEGESLIEERRAQRRVISLMETALHAAPWENALPENGGISGFQLFAQPIVDLHDASLISFEVLLRWRVDGELRAPATFLPLAERHGLMPAIDRWVLNHTLRQLALYPAALAHIGKVSINLSGSSLSDVQLLGDLRAAVLSSGIAADRLCFEITETMAIPNPDKALALLRGLREMGCAVSLDDFGTGLASFAYLKAFPFDMLKIDGLFIKNLARSPQDQTMVAAICAVARSMGLRTVAEFVEDAATIDMLRHHGVDAVQGYGVGRPEPLMTALANLSNTSSPTHDA